MNRTLRSFVLAGIALILSLCLSISAFADQKYNYEDREFNADLYYETLEVCAAQIRKLTDFEPEIVVVLGSGLGDFADAIEPEIEIPYSEIVGFPDSTAPDHEGTLVFGTCAGRKLAVMKGRIHYYEGYSMYDVVLPIRVLNLLGADTVILTNAVGSLNPDYVTGEFVAIEDHIASFVPSPLIGENIDELGERFTDMTHIYDAELLQLVQDIGKEKGIPVHSGIFLQVTGPQFETPAEIRLYRSLGADTISMSTAAEAIAARHLGMRVCGVSCVTNMAAGMEDVELTPDLINQNADKTTENFTVLIQTLIERMPPVDAPKDPGNAIAQDLGNTADQNAGNTASQDSGNAVISEGTDTVCEITGYHDYAGPFRSYFLEEGDKVAVISPSALPSREQVDATVNGLKTWGYEPVEGNYVCVEERTLENCLEDLKWALEDPEVKAVFCVRGGYAATEVMDQLPEDIIASANKPIIGYSDITVYHAAWNSAGLPSIHASMSAAFMNLPEDCTEAEQHLLKGQIPEYQCAASGYDRTGSAEGILIGGNLSTMTAVVSTAYDSTQTDQPYILLLEEVEEDYEHIHRYLTVLKHYGVLDRAAGIVFGEWVRIPASNETYNGRSRGGEFKSVADMISREFFADTDIPVAFGFPAGHGNRNYPLLMGENVQLVVTDEYFTLK